MAHKPKSILELGYGHGITNAAIRESIAFNGVGHLTVVDNFYDGVWFTTPGLIVDSEEHFVGTTPSTFDFIVSDADHHNSHRWCHRTAALLSPGGIAVFHDITNPDFPNLRRIMDELPGGLLFNRSSRDDEKCYRGLYVYSRPVEI